MQDDHDYLNKYDCAYKTAITLYYYIVLHLLN
jgi:hypothetical protein